PAAWDITTGDPSIFLAIAEGRKTGFNFTHPEVANKIVGNVSYYGTEPPHFHGTAVAGTAAGDTDNGLGLSSIGFNCRMYTLYGYNPVVQLDSLLNMGIRVFNMSFGNTSGELVEEEAMEDAYLRGAILIASAGNDPTALRSYPAAYDHVISVTSVGDQMNHDKVIGDPSTAHWHGSSVDLVAPGHDVVVPINSQSYAYGNGSSYAAPMVAGLVGLMLSVNPCLSPDDVELILKATALPVDNLPINAAYTGQLGAGLIQADAAVQMAQSYASALPTIPKLNPSFHHYITCDDDLDLNLHVSGTRNPLSTHHQWNLYEQSNTNQSIDQMAWWQVSPNGYNRDTLVFSTVLQPNTHYMVKRGVWDGCTPWFERRQYNIQAPSCFVQFGYALDAEPDANGCVTEYKVSGENLDLVDRVSFILVGATTRSYTDFSLPFRQPIAPYQDTQITATLHFHNGKTYTLTENIPTCDPLIPWRSAVEETLVSTAELSLYPNPVMGEEVQLQHPASAHLA
ncbi:MAG TPA: hypothetical protein DCE41_31765, partial [Cytophagales bacterium]|nr:hypothetical protein [Cytophagales bacterium]